VFEKLRRESAVSNLKVYLELKEDDLSKYHSERNLRKKIYHLILYLTEKYQIESKNSRRNLTTLLSGLVEFPNFLKESLNDYKDYKSRDLDYSIFIDSFWFFTKAIRDDIIGLGYRDSIDKWDELIPEEKELLRGDLLSRYYKIKKKIIR